MWEEKGGITMPSFLVNLDNVNSPGSPFLRADMESISRKLTGRRPGRQLTCVTCSTLPTSPALCGKMGH
jgi:hypothetical protein